MKYEISLSEDKTFIRIRVFEAITGEIEKEFAGKAINDAKQFSISKFLVDVRSTRNVASSLEQYLFGYENMNQFGLDKNSRVAILSDADDTSHNFIETVLVNAGYQCRLFIDEGSALKWLGE